MKDKDIATLLLSLEKALVKDYSVALSESSTEKFSKKIEKLSETSIKLHRDLFDLMLNKGWYQITNASMDEVNKESNKLENELNMINN